MLLRSLDHRILAQLWCTFVNLRGMDMMGLARRGIVELHYRGTDELWSGATRR